MNTKNNSKEMKTVVETFLMEETIDLTYDQVKLNKWNDLIKELDLKGQSKVRSFEKSPIPFKYMDETLHDIAETLCPRKVDVKDYNEMPIPLEIVEFIAMSIRENYFSKIEVWSDSKDKDPFVIGVLEEHYVRDSNWNRFDKKSFKTKKECEESMKSFSETGLVVTQAYGDTQYYLIGKWGDVKESFEKLKIKAFNKFMKYEKNILDERLIDVKREISDLSIKANKRFNL